jgi:hypothetical protein
MRNQTNGGEPQKVIGFDEAKRRVSLKGQRDMHPEGESPAGERPEGELEDFESYQLLQEMKEQAAELAELGLDIEL